jgi:D-alanyl-D-alanine carboxypeptidase
MLIETTDGTKADSADPRPGIGKSACDLRLKTNLSKQYIARGPDEMKRLICTLGVVIGAGLCADAALAEEVECFATPEAVLAAYPDTAHVRYTHQHRATRCYFADDREDAEIRPSTRRAARTDAPAAASQVTQARRRAITAPEPATTAAAPGSDTKTTAPEPTAPELAVNPQELDRLLPTGKK